MGWSSASVPSSAVFDAELFEDAFGLLRGAGLAAVGAGAFVGGGSVAVDELFACGAALFGSAFDAALAGGGGHVRGPPV
jgi:hypothetical protein